MLEMLFSFSIFCLVSSFLPLFFTILFEHHSIDARIQKMEWELFANQLKKEIQCSDGVVVLSGVLRLTNGAETISFQHYQKLIRRRVDSKGHEVVLQNVERVHYEHKGNSIYIEVKDSFGKTYHATIFFFKGSG